MSKVVSVLPANRVAALTAVISGIAGAATSLASVWPSAATNEIALIGGAVLTGAGTLAHIVGSIAWDHTPAGQAQGFARSAAKVTDGSGVAKAQARADELEAKLATVRAALASSPQASAPEA